MFIKLTHGLHAVLNAIVSYIQKWTDDSVPDGTRTLHNFKDGQGKRPAVPLDELNSSNNIVNVKTDSKFEHGSDDVTNSENVLKVELKTELGYGDDNLVSKTGIENTVCVPEPVIFEIHNEVPDKIEKVVPVKTQALPGQDFIFQILYVKDYNYIEGDILPVFGSWGNYAHISRDGKYLTVNSNADLSVRLILTPAPQDWDPDKPDPSIIQEETDKMLKGIPRDGSRVMYDIEQSIIEDNFYTVSIENQATTFVTNGEFANGKYYNVDAKTKKISIPMTFAEGFDEQSIYWKCYDDPKSATPVTGNYPTIDYNDEYGPLPDGFRKLQYIYTNDNAYIDLGIKLKKDYKCKALMNVTNRTDTSSIAIFGARNSTNTDWYYDDRTDGAYACYTRYYGYETIGFQRGTKRSFTQSGISSIYGQLCWYYSTGTSFEVQKYDGTVIRRNTIAAAQNIDTDWNCYLFTVNDKGTPYLYGVRGNMYRFEMWDENDNLIMRLIPAKNLDTGSCGMYDIINNKFYYNKRIAASFGGAEFYVWQKEMQTSDHENVLTLNDISPISDYNADINLPEEYYKLAGVYFQSAYIDTQYKLKKDDKVEVIAKVDTNTSNGYRVLFGSRTSSSSQDSYFFFTRYGYNNYFAYGKNGGENSSSASVYDTIFKLVTNQTQATWYVNEVQKGQITRSGTGADSTYTCWLGCGNNANAVDSYNLCTIYSFKIFDKDDNLKLYFIPCVRKSDNEIGFYDYISGQFFKKTGGTLLASKNITEVFKKELVIENVTKDIRVGIIRNPVYDNPFEVSNDGITSTYTITDSSITDYFYVVETSNSATDYVSVSPSYKAINLGNSDTFTLTYKSGYDNYDITCTANNSTTVELGKTHYITYNELDIPPEYTVITGIKSERNYYNLYYKTGYIPKWDDRIVCYASISTDRYTTPCYVFGSRNGEGNRSFVFYAHRDSSNNMGYDRSCGVKNIRSIINNELVKIEADNNGCLCDYAYTQTKINTQMAKVIPAHDYNSDVTLPDAYTKLSYLQNTNQSHINTSLPLKQTYKVELITNIISENTSNTWNALFGSEAGSANSCYSIYSRSNGNRRFTFSLGNKDNVGTQNFDFGKDYIIRTSSEAFKLYDKDENLLQTIVPTGTPSVSNYSAYLFTLNGSNSSYYYRPNARIYSYKVYDENDTLICRMIPARRNSDSVVGMYDIVRNTFYTNAGSNSFSWSYINESEYQDNEYEMYLFNCNHANNLQYSFTGAIYKFTVYASDGTIKHNLVPVKRLEDNVIGFYDTIKSVFFPPNNRTPIEATVPTYKGKVTVSNIPSDTVITFKKNDNARKPISLETIYENDYERKHIDELEWNYVIRTSSIEDYFYTVKYINGITRVCSVSAQVASYYNTPLVGQNTRFPITYNIGYDHDNIQATATNGATVEITEALKIVYEKIPDDYIQIAGLYNNNTSTYFMPLNNSGDEDKPYYLKATDSIRLWVRDEKYSYTQYYFGAGTSIDNNGFMLASKYESSNNIFYSRNQRKNLTGLANEVVMFDCKPSEITYTNGYDTYSATLTNTPTDCNTALHIFGRCYNSNNTYHDASFQGTIYKFQIYDDNGLKYNLIPCKRKSDYTLGFYDTIGDKFYTPIQGSVSEASAPKLKGSIIVRNITNDTDLIISEKLQPTLNIVSDDSVSYNYSIEASSISDMWYYVSVNNTTNGLISITNATYGGNCYVCNSGNDLTIPVTYKAGYSNTDFIVSEGTLTNNGIVFTNIKNDKNITIMKNDYHDPRSETADDLGIFTNPDFSDYSQYRAINGTDLMLTSFTFINSQVAAMTNREIYEFNLGEIDILAFDPSNVPGAQVKTKIACNDSNFLETVQTVTIDGKTMYKHTVTLKNQIKMETGKVYIFKVRDRSDTGKLIAYAKDTTSMNLVNSQGEVYIQDNIMYFEWNEANKYIVQGNKNIYFELNGIKL